MLGSMKAGLAFSNAILGAVHAMSHSLGGYLDLPHGLCNSILLDHVIDFNYKSTPERFRAIAEQLEIDTRGMSNTQVKSALLTKVRNLKQQVGLSMQLSEAGVKLTDIPILASKAIIDPCILTNPRASNKRDFLS